MKQGQNEEIRDGMIHRFEYEKESVYKHLAAQVPASGDDTLAAHAIPSGRLACHGYHIPVDMPLFHTSRAYRWHSSMNHRSGRAIHPCAVNEFCRLRDGEREHDEWEGGVEEV